MKLLKQNKNRDLGVFIKENKELPMLLFLVAQKQRSEEFKFLLFQEK